MSQWQEMTPASPDGSSCTKALTLLGPDSSQPEHAAPPIHEVWPLADQQEKKTTRSAASPLANVRLLPLIAVLFVATAGMILSLLFLSSGREAAGFALPAHPLPVSILFIIGLMMLGAFVLSIRGKRLYPVPTWEKGQLLCSTRSIHLANQQDVQDQEGVEQMLRQIWARVFTLPIRHISGNSDFFRCGGDSDVLSALLGEIERQIRISLDPNDVFDHPTLGRLAAVVVSKQQKAEGQTTIEVM